MAQYTGKIAWFNDSQEFIFLASEGVRDVFCYRSSFEEDGYQALVEGELVEYDLEQGAEGTQAVHVKRLHAG